MNIIRTFGPRTLHLKRFFHAFKKPPIYKRKVVPSDLDINKIKTLYDCEKEKWIEGDISGKDLYYPKYGASLYDDTIKLEFEKEGKLKKNK